MPIISCKVELLLKWIEKCALTTPVIGADANVTGADIKTFKITDAKLNVSVATSPVEDSVKLVKQLSE